MPWLHRKYFFHFKIEYTPSRVYYKGKRAIRKLYNEFSCLIVTLIWGGEEANIFVTLTTAVIEHLPAQLKRRNYLFCSWFQGVLSMVTWFCFWALSKNISWTRAVHLRVEQGEKEGPEPSKIAPPARSQTFNTYHWGMRLSR
jgi:hypothetical protein